MFSFSIGYIKQSLPNPTPHPKHIYPMYFNLKFAQHERIWSFRKSLDLKYSYICRHSWNWIRSIESKSLVIASFDAKLKKT